MGYPLVEINGYKNLNGKCYLTLKQERFILGGQADELNSVWQIPITICTKSNPTTPKAKFFMTKSEEKFLLENIPKYDWIKVSFLLKGIKQNFLIFKFDTRVGGRGIAFFVKA